MVQPPVSRPSLQGAFRDPLRSSCPHVGTLVGDTAVHTAVLGTPVAPGVTVTPASHLGPWEAGHREA